MSRAHVSGRLAACFGNPRAWGSPVTSAASATWSAKDRKRGRYQDRRAPKTPARINLGGSDDRPIGPFQIKLIAWSFFIVLIDGYDIAAIAFAALYLVQSWGVAPSALGPVFSASLIGILIGSAIFGWVGDRFGRKVALVSSNLLFGVFTLAAAYSTSLDQMFWVRLLAGLGIGGVILFLPPTLIAIAVVSMRFAFRIDNHFGFSDGADKDFGAMMQISVR